MTLDQPFTTHSAQETRDWGARLVRELQPYFGQAPIVLLLSGPLGAGKTSLVQGIAQTLGVTETVRSPSYSLADEYELPPLFDVHWLYHLDAWRLSEHETLADLGLEEFLRPDALTIIEWAETKREEVHELLQGALGIAIRLEYGNEPDDRTITIQGTL